MNDKSTTQHGSTAREQARKWVLRFDGDSTPGPEDIEALRAWLKEDPSHLDELKRAEAIWHKSADMASHISPSLKARTTELPTFHDEPFAPQPSSPYFTRVAILIPLIALCGLLLWSLMPQTGSSNGHHSTGVGQIVSLTLEDQSTIHLDSNSNIEVAYGDNQRTIYLTQGRAYFDVAKDADRPFIVSTPTGFVRAVGTAFSVSFEERAVKVAVAEGIVDIGRKSSALMHSSPVREADVVARLEAGKTAVFDKATETISKQDISDIEDSQAWKDGYLVFKGQSLETVIAEILRYTDTEITIQDPSLKSLAIGGRFKTGEVATLLDTLELTFGIKVAYLAPKKISLETSDNSSQ